MHKDIWNIQHTNIAIVFSLAVIFLHAIAFPNYLMPFIILSTGTMIIFFFFVLLNYYNRIWQGCTSFTTRLFFHSLGYRIIGIALLYMLTYFYDPANLPMEVKALDSWNYHRSGCMVADALREDRSVTMALARIWKSETDYGFATIIGYIYFLFGKNILLIKLFNALFSSLTVVRIYQIAQITHDERSARLAGILTMLMPALLWFNGFFLKETILMFIIVNIGFLTYKIILKRKLRIINTILILLHFGVVFYFRVVLAPLLIACTILQILGYRTSNRNYKISSVLISVLFVVGSFVVMQQLGMDKHIEAAIEASQDQFGNELSDTSKKRGVTYAAAIISPILIAAAIITPFPSLLNFDKEQLGIYAHFQNEIVRNGMYFFVFLGLFNAYKTKNKATLFVGGFALIYIMILAASGISFQDRFQILALPFLLIFMADGIAKHYPKRTKHWIHYLSVIFVIILCWNLFKLSNRGLI